MGDGIAKQDLIMLTVQSVVTMSICGMATFASVSAEVISGDALVGLYGAAVGYVFGHQSGSRRIAIEGPRIVDRREADALPPE